jgi:DNA-3-methyladenine glycosylase II
MSRVIQAVGISPVAAMNEDDNWMRAGAAGQSKIAELLRIFAVRDPRVGLGRRELENILTQKRAGGGEAQPGSSQQCSASHSETPFYRRQQAEGRKREAAWHTCVMDATAACAELALDYQPPYDWAAFLRFVKPRAIPGLERVDDDSYHRSGVTVRKHPDGDRLIATNSDPSIASQIRFFFDLDADPHPIAAHLAKSRLLKKIVGRHPGLRVPRCWDPFELAVRAMLGQQVTVKGASTLAGRLVEQFGPPQAPILAGANLAAIGLPQARAESIRGFARAVCDQRIRFDGEVSSQDMIGRMCELPGIGPWTANYIAMRALGDQDAFPASDLGLLRAARVSSPRKLAELAERWRPWRSYAAMYLWESLHDDE